MPVKGGRATFSPYLRRADISCGDEEEPPKPRRVTPLPLDPLGVEELRDYIAELQAEIGRVEVAIARKHDHRSVADSFFRK